MSDNPYANYHDVDFPTRPGMEPDKGPDFTVLSQQDGHIPFENGIAGSNPKDC